MKNKQNYCKYIIQFNSIQFNSIQFNSIQFNSIPKIVFLIALLFLLSFSISCSSNEEPEPERKYLELAGTWRARYDAGYVYINIDNDGNFILTNGHRFHEYFNYTGKLADNFEYPYTIELVYDAYSSVLFDELTEEYYRKAEPKQTNGKFTFIDASTCNAHFHKISWGGIWGELIYSDTNNSHYWKSFKKL